MTERKKLEFISSVEIMNTPMKKQRFIVDGMIYIFIIDPAKNQYVLSLYL